MRQKKPLSEIPQNIKITSRAVLFITEVTVDGVLHEMRVL